MRIFYGVMGEGLGHVMRARVVGKELERRGHQLLFASSGRAAALLRRDFSVTEIKGMHLRYRHGAVQRGATLLENVRATPKRLRHNLGAPFEDALAFDPNVVITDFESLAHTVGLVLGRPVISLDHQHVITTCDHRAIRQRLPRDLLATLLATHAFVASKTPRCDRYVVTSFFFPPRKKRHLLDTTVVGPILRPELADLTPRQGEHVLVYQTAAGDPDLLPALAGVSNVPFVIYGARGDAVSKNIEHRAFDLDRFAADLAGARAVISNGGYTALAEARYFGKPVLSIPIRHQGEQEINAAYVDALGLGMRARRMTSGVVRDFLATTWTPRRDPRLDTGTADAVRAVERALDAAA